jgi:uncharacterized membrane protein YbhN (UPF0104 family)
MTEESPGLESAEEMRRWWHSKWPQVVVSVVVVALIFGFLFPQVADYGEVWNTIRAMTSIEIATLLLVAGWNIVSYWPLLTACQPELRVREAAVANLSSTAISNTLPGGAALGVGTTLTMQRSWGIPVSSTALALVVAGIWNNFAKLGLPIIALGLLAVSGGTGAGLTVAALVGLVVLAVAVTGFTLLLRSERLADRVGDLSGRAMSAVLHLVRRGPVVGWGEKAQHFRGRTVGLLSHRWKRITLTTLISHLSLFLVLLVSLRHIGVSQDEVRWQEAFAGFAFVRLLSAVPLTPGGLGVVELGLTAALGSGLPDSTKNQVAAAVLVFRALTWFVPIPLGIGGWLFWRSNRSWRHTVEERACLPASVTP